MALASRDLDRGIVSEAAIEVGGEDESPAPAEQGVTLAGPVGRYYAPVGKPVVDFLGAVILTVVVLPVGILVAVLVRISLGKGVLYRQERIGRYGRPFIMYKFRSMRADRRVGQVPFPGIDRRICHKREDDPRHTRVGRLLRRTRVDELPQMWNVIKGDMSLVGPRPELPHVVSRYEPWQHDRHQVKPGLTGLWQVSDRAVGLAYEAVDLDIEYLGRLSFSTDCAILLRTLPVIARRTGH
jgi:lipopolysaccharide/colanic/teichoic acid biosynthesis glycosyltransferase